MTSNLKRAIDTDLSRLCTTQRQRAMILDNALEGKKVKRKLSVGFVLVTAMLLIAAIALAVATIQDTGRMIAQTEQEIGDYIDWPVEKKLTVVRELMDEGYIQETAQRRQLYDGTLTGEEAAQVADEAVAAFTGDEARYVSFLSIMNAAWGPFEQWTQEQQAWYSQVMTDVGAETDGKTYYVMPSGPLNAQEALAIAKQEIARGFDLEEGMLDKYRVVEVSFQIPEFSEPGDTKAYWYVCLDTWHTELEDQEGLPFGAIDVFVDPDSGALLEPIEEKVAARKAAAERSNHPLMIAVRKLEKSIGEEQAFHTWSLENKARWSTEIAPQIRAYFAEHLKDDTLLFGVVQQARTLFTYGLPDDKAIPQEQALAISRDALRTEYDLSNEELSLIFDNGSSLNAPSVFYDITHTERPLWKFLLRMPSIYDADDALAARVKALYGTDTAYDQLYKAEIDAYTGEVVRVLKMRYMPDTLEGYRDIY